MQPVFHQLSQPVSALFLSPRSLTSPSHPGRTTEAPSSNSIGYFLWIPIYVNTRCFFSPFECFCQTNRRHRARKGIITNWHMFESFAAALHWMDRKIKSIHRLIYFPESLIFKVALFKCFHSILLEQWAKSIWVQRKWENSLAFESHILHWHALLGKLRDLFFDSKFCLKVEKFK